MSNTIINQKYSLRISICVVLYRAEEETTLFHQKLIDSLREFSDFEINYYDNSPTDILRHSLCKRQLDCKVSYIHDKRNLGFSYGNNRLILDSNYEKILLLNPDVYGFCTDVWSFISNYPIGDNVIFAKLLNSDGSFQDCIGEIVSIRRALLIHRDYSTVESRINIGMGIMAFMLTEKKVYANVGLLDTDYSLYAEDMDWCYRASKKGYSIIYEPQIVLTHSGGSSAKSLWSIGDILRKKYEAERLFINKHTQGFNWITLRALNVIKILKSYLHN